MRVLLDQSVGLACLLPNVFGQDPVQGQELRSEERIHSSFTSSFLARPALASARASSAKLERRSTDIGWENYSSHRCSDSISRRMIEAIASCSSSGSSRAFSKAFSMSLVIHESPLC